MQLEIYKGTLAEKYERVKYQLHDLLQDETNLIANLANTSALLFQFLPNVNWVGFYLHHENELILGPFQGLPARVRIPIGEGVCGKVAQQKKTIVIHDTNAFSKCSPHNDSSCSIIAIPIRKKETIIGVLHIDSPLYSRFCEKEKEHLEQFVRALEKHL